MIQTTTTVCERENDFRVTVMKATRSTKILYHMTFGKFDLSPSPGCTRESFIEGRHAITDRLPVECVPKAVTIALRAIDEYQNQPHYIGRPE